MLTGQRVAEDRLLNIRTSALLLSYPKANPSVFLFFQLQSLTHSRVEAYFEGVIETTIIYID